MKKVPYREFQKLIDLASANVGVNDSLIHIAMRNGKDEDHGASYEDHGASYSRAKFTFINAARQALGETPLFE
jgi:hypothetical protein